jgi:hypothetical protein
LLHPSTSLDNQVIVKDWSVIDFLVSNFLKPLTGFDNQAVQKIYLSNSAAVSLIRPLVRMSASYGMLMTLSGHL